MKFVKLFLPIVCLAAMADANAELKVGALTLEMAEEPLCVEAKAPRFSWKLQSDQKNVRQTTYRIRVAEKPEALADKSGKGLVWDSGEVASDQSVYISYAGEDLQPMTSY